MDPVDPSTRWASQIAPPLGAGPPLSTESPLQAQARASVEELLPRLVRRVSWSGDGRRGTIRLELGAGALAGATLLVHAEAGVVRVELHAPAGVDAAGFRDRIAERLTLRGLNVQSVRLA